MTRDEYKNRVQVYEKELIGNAATALEIQKSILACGGIGKLSAVIGYSEPTIRWWKTGLKMKATTAVEFETTLNAWLDKRGESIWRCKREKLIAWFFEK